MASLLLRGIGTLVKSLAGLSCGQAPRCSSSSLPSGISSLQFSSTRCFSERPTVRDHPKRPLSAYIRYFMDQHVILHKQHPDLKRTEITRKIGQEWKALPDFVKEPYIVAANAERQKYKEEVKIYEDHLTPLEKKVQKAERQQKLAKRKSSRKRRELINMGKPKRARNAFNIFMSEHFQDASGMKAKEKFKSLFDDWGILESSRKQTYIQLAEDDKIRYENEMKSWEEQMIEIGREDLIRLKQRNKLKKLRPILKGPKVASKKKKTSVSRLKQSRKTAEPNEGRKARSRISRHEE